MIDSRVAIVWGAMFVAIPARAQLIPASSAAAPPGASASSTSAGGAPVPVGRAGGLIAPKAVDVSATYPEGAHGSGVVLLELVLGVDGLVVEAKVLAGEPPFSDAALAAARTFRFEPATRDGKPVPARIRYSLRFEAPPDEPNAADTVREPPPAPSSSIAPSPSTRPAPSASTGSSAKKTQDAPLAITVQGERRAPGSVTLTREEAREMPGAFGDPLRAIEAQPGVVPIVSGAPTFFIRGAPPSNVGVFIDGVDVPLLYHAFFGPSVIHPTMIKSVDLYRGVSPVQYGRFAGPVVAANLSPFERRFRGEASLRSIDVGAMLEAPLGRCGVGDVSDCARGNARVSGRYSYTGLILSALGDTKLDYWDYQGQANYRLGPRDEVSVLAFGGYDLFRASAAANKDQGGRVEFHRVDLRYDRHTPNGATMRLALTGGFDRSAGTNEKSSAVTDHSLRLRFEFASPVNDAVTVRTGFDARVDRFGLHSYPLYLSFPDYSVLFPERTEYVVGGFLASELRVGRFMTLVPGMRVDSYYASGTTAVGLDPRLRVLFEPGANMTLEYSLGLSHQRANSVGQVPGAQVASLEGGLQEALLSSAGLRWKLPGQITASATAFRNLYYNAIDPIGGGRNFEVDRTSLDRRSTISAYGVELGLSRSLSRKLGGLISYTLSRSEQTTNGRTAVSGFDRTHVLQVALSYDFGRGIRVGTRSIVYSGVPELYLEGYPHMSSARRGAAFFRLDVRVEKRWQIGNAGWLSVIGEVLNATATREVVRLECGSICAERFAGPVVLPSLGAEAGF